MILVLNLMMMKYPPSILSMALLVLGVVMITCSVLGAQWALDTQEKRQEYQVV